MAIMKFRENCSKTKESNLAARTPSDGSAEIPDRGLSIFSRVIMTNDLPFTLVHCYAQDNIYIYIYIYIYI